jgi:hypothetical protein
MLTRNVSALSWLMHGAACYLCYEHFLSVGLSQQVDPLTRTINVY